MTKEFTREKLNELTELARSVQGDGNINYIARLALLAAMSNEKSVTGFIEATQDDMVIDIVEVFVEQGFKVGFKRNSPHIYEIDLSWG